MPEEKVFLSQGDLYVSNTRVVLRGTTYATANITSVRRHFTPASNGCAVALIVIGLLAALGSLPALLADFGSGSLFAAFMSVALLLIGIGWHRSLKPTYHVVLASAGGERQGYSSTDLSTVDGVTAAVADAITYRG